MVEPIRVTEPGLTKIVIRRDRRNNNNTVHYFLFELDCYFILLQRRTLPMFMLNVSVTKLVKVPKIDKFVLEDWSRAKKISIIIY